MDIAPKRARGSITWQTPQQMPQEHPKKTIEISGSLYQRMEDAKPEYLSTTGFFQLMADKGLMGIDTVCYPQRQSTAEALEGSRPRLKAPKDKNSSQEQDSSLRVAEAITNKERARDLYKTKQLNPDLIPGDLLDVQQLLPEWWAVKKGVRSEGVFNRVCKALRGMTPEDRRTCLERATSGAWANIYEPDSSPTQSARTSNRPGIVPLAISPQMQAWLNDDNQEQTDA